MALPNDVRDAMTILRGKGFKAYVVGGAVRDLILGLKPNDYDIATDAKPEEVLEVFRRAGWVVVPKGIEYGVVSVVHPISRREIEVATFRKEFYAEDFNRRSAKVTFSKELKDDVERRDFTINALAMDEEGNILDYVGGINDLRKGIIRFVGEPGERIREDPLRMLRAVRFASKLGFEVHPSAMEAIRRNRDLIKYVSWERIGEEIMKASKTPRFADFLMNLKESGLYKHVLPELEGMIKTVHRGSKYHRDGESVLEHTYEVLKHLDKLNASPNLKIAGLLHDIGKPLTAKETNGRVVFHKHEHIGSEIAGRVLRRWRFPSRTITYITAIVRNHMLPHYMAATLTPKKAAARLVSRLGGYAPDITLLAIADTYGKEPKLKELHNEVKKLLKQPKPLLNGYDIMRIYGIKPSPTVGKIKRILHEIQLTHGIKDKEELIRTACTDYGICPNKKKERMMNTNPLQL